MHREPILPRIGEAVHFRAKLSVKFNVLADGNKTVTEDYFGMIEAIGTVLSPPKKGYIQLKVDSVQDPDTGLWMNVQNPFSSLVVLDDVDL